MRIKGYLFLGTAFLWHSQDSPAISLKRKKAEHILQAAVLPTLRKKYHVDRQEFCIATGTLRP